MNRPSPDEARHRADGARLAAAMRIGLTCMALMAFWLDPTVVFGNREFAWVVLALYAGYSVLVAALHASGAGNIPARLAPWIDVIGGSLLISFSGGTNSIFFSFFVFAVLVGAFQGGVRTGRWLLLGAVLSFVAVGFATAPRGSTFELDRALMRPMYLMALGSLVLYWVGHETRLRRRLALLRDVMTLSNPRFGVDQTVQMVLGRLRSFYAAEACHLVTAPGEGEPSLRLYSEPSRQGRGTQIVDVGFTGIADLLFRWPDDVAVLYRDGGRFGSTACDVLQADSLKRSLPDAQQRRLATLLDARSFVSIPWSFESAGKSRLLLISTRPRSFHASDLRFLQQLLGQLSPVLENVRLVERLASQAADEERRRIAGNIHDSVIQPYIGLRLAIAAVREKMRGGAVNEAAQDLDRLVELSETEVSTLRRYVQDLREGQSGPGEAVLESSIRRFSDRFSALSAIAVDFQSDPGLTVNDRLAAEIFQMVSEGLSNIRRHTDATKVRVRLSCQEGRMSLLLEDNGSDSRPDFLPRSLDERTRALGGRMQRRAVEGHSVLEIQVPL